MFLINIFFLGTAHHETDSSTTVISTKSVMDSDGNVSVTRDVLQGTVFN